MPAPTTEPIFLAVCISFCERFFKVSCPTLEELGESFGSLRAKYLPGPPRTLRWLPLFEPCPLLRAELASCVLYNFRGRDCHPRSSFFSPKKILLLPNKMEQTLELSDSPRSAARQFMALLIELSTQRGGSDSSEMNTEEIREKSAPLCPNAPSIEDRQEKPADNGRK